MSYSEYKLFFGDLHAHSNVSGCGRCFGRDLLKRDTYLHVSLIEEYRARKLAPEETIDLIYEFAKERSRLDFVAVTDHDYNISDETWDVIKRKASEWYSPGRFVTFSAYEWTSYVYGHRNVYFLVDDAPIFRCTDFGEYPWRVRGYSPRDLWSFLRKHNVRAITVPHHPTITDFPVDWSYYDPEYDRLVEVTSQWGVFEYYGNPFQCVLSDNLPRFFVVDALERGYRLGFVGGSDSHDCRPGDSIRAALPRLGVPKDFKLNSLNQFFVPYHMPNPLGSGLAAIYAEELTRESLFEALYKRRVYALTSDRIKLKFSIDGRLMGEEIVVDDPSYRPVLEVSVEGVKDLDRVEVVKNGRVVYRKICKGKTAFFKFVDESEPLRAYNYYYVRVVQRNGARAWSSPIWVIYRNLGKIEARYEKSTRLLSLRNSGRRELKDLRVAFLRELRQEARAPDVFSKESFGAFFWTEEKSVDEIVLKIRFKSSVPRNFRGWLRLYGCENYFVKPVGFAIVKYGGDLFTDDYSGLIEWDITPSSRLNMLDIHSVKGLDVLVKINPFEKAYAQIEVLQDGEADTAHTFAGNNPVDRIPFKIQLNYLKDFLLIKEIKNLSPLKESAVQAPREAHYALIYPCEQGYFGPTAKLLKLA